MSCRPNFDPTINYIAGLAALTLRTLKSTIRDQKWMQSTRKSMKIDRRRPGMLRGCLSGPPAPRFVDSYARRVGTNENSRER
jgi:hypothetical protein